MKLSPLYILAFSLSLLISGCEDSKPTSLNTQDDDRPEDDSGAPSSMRTPLDDTPPPPDDQNITEISDLGAPPNLDATVNLDLNMPPASPSHTLEFVAPESLTGAPRSTQDVEVEVRVHQLETSLDGWSFAFSTRDLAHCHISSVSTQETISAEAGSDSVGIVVDGFVESRVIEAEGISSALSAVIFSMQSNVKLEPPAAQVSLFRFTLQVTFPELGSSAQCHLMLSDSISVMGRPLKSILVSHGESLPFSMAPTSIELRANSTSNTP